MLSCYRYFLVFYSIIFLVILNRSLKTLPIVSEELEHNSPVVQRVSSVQYSTSAFELTKATSINCRYLEVPIWDEYQIAIVNIHYVPIMLMCTTKQNQKSPKDILVTGIK